MTRRAFGWTGVPVPVVGQGTWQLGERPEDEARALVRGLELGLTHLDTAELYGKGEAVCGDAIRASGRRRDELFVVSKVMPKDATRRGTVEACERSLQTLGLAHLDVFLLHWRGPHALEQTMRGLEDLVAQGKTRHLGVSNFDVSDLEEAEAALGGRARLACNQVYYDLEHRGIERRLIPWCQARGVAVVGYSPFGSSKPPGPGDRGGDALAAVARARGATIPQVVLAFLTRLEGTFTIPRATKLPHVEDNAGALAVRLTQDDVARIDAAFPTPSRDIPLESL